MATPGSLQDPRERRSNRRRPGAHQRTPGSDYRAPRPPIRPGEAGPQAPPQAASQQDGQPPAARAEDAQSLDRDLAPPRPQDARNLDSNLKPPRAEDAGSLDRDLPPPRAQDARSNDSNIPAPRPEDARSLDKNLKPPRRQDLIKPDSGKTLSKNDGDKIKQKEAALANETGSRGRTSSSSALKEKENDEPLNYEPEQKGKKGKSKKSSRGRGKAVLGLGTTGIVAIITLFTIFGGRTFEIIFIAKALEGIYETLTLDLGESRMGKLVRYLRYPDTPENRRLGVLRNAYAGKLEARMKAQGIEMRYNSSGLVDRIYIDSNRVDEFRNDSKLGEEYKKRLRIDNINPDGPDYGRAYLDFSDLDTNKNAFMRSAIKNIVGKTELGRVASFVSSRTLAKKANVKFRALGNLDNKLSVTARGKTSDAIKKIREVRKEYISKGANAVRARLPGGDTSTEALNAEADRLAGANGDTTDVKLQNVRDVDFNKAGAVLGAMVLSCAVYEVADNYPAIERANVIEPLIRKYNELLTLGSELQAFTSLTSLDEIGAFTEGLYDFNGVVPNSFWDAAPLLYEQGLEPSSFDVNSAARVTTNDTKQQGLYWYKQALETAFPAIGTACAGLTSTPGQYIAQGVDVLVGFFSGGTKEVVEDLLVDKYITGPAFSYAFRWVIGEQVDTFALGAEYGADVAHGGRHSSNEVLSGFGAAELSPAEEFAWHNERVEELQQERAEQGFAYNLFSPDNPYSVASRLARKVPTNLASLRGMASSIFSGKMFMQSISTLMASTQAQSATGTYDYGFPLIAFSKAELEDPRVENPYESARVLEEDLKYDIQEMHNAYAKTCFGLTIKEGTGPEDPGTVTIDKIDNMYNAPTELIPGAEEVTRKDCKDGGGKKVSDKIVTSEAFLRYRFYIADSMLMTVEACNNDDEQACTDLGYTTSGGGAQATNLSDGVVVGDTFATPCSSGTDLGEAEAHSGGQLYRIRLCLVEGIDVNSEISAEIASLLAAAKSDGLDLATGTGGYRTMAEQAALRIKNGCPDVNTSPSSSCRVPTARPGYSNHEMGLALDFRCNGGSVTSGSACFRWLTNNAATYGLKNLPSEPWHWSVNGK